MTVLLSDLSSYHTGELGYDRPLYDGLLHMTDDMLGPSPMHIKYSSYVYDGFCIIWRTNFPGPIESVISKFTCIWKSTYLLGNMYVVFTEMYLEFTLHLALSTHLVHLLVYTTYTKINTKKYYTKKSPTGITSSLVFQGSKLGGAKRPGLPWILLRLPHISAGSPKQRAT